MHIWQAGFLTGGQSTGALRHILVEWAAIWTLVQPMAQKLERATGRPFNVWLPSNTAPASGAACTAGKRGIIHLLLR